MSEDDTEAQRQAILIEMRTQFQKADYEGAIQSFGGLGDMKTIRSGIRIEAISIAARSYAALGSRREAVKLMNQAGNRPLKHHRLYRHLAAACLDLGEYRRAAELALSAADLAEGKAEQA